MGGFKSDQLLEIFSSAFTNVGGKAKCIVIVPEALYLNFQIHVPCLMGLGAYEKPTWFVIYYTSLHILRKLNLCL